MSSGIYIITNIINNKIYIGSTINFSKRWKKHKQHLNNNKHINYHLQKAWNKYGEKCFKFEILQEVSYSEHLISYEQVYMDYYKSYAKNIGYNIRIKADSNLGIKRRETTRKKLSIIAKQRKMKKETKLKISLSLTGDKNHFYGKKHKKESRILMGAKGEKHFKAKLTWDKVREIRKLYKTGNFTNIQMSKMFSVHNSQICRIIANKIWREENE